jgi:RNA polymerase sigma factor for flagellar operon FliA
MSANMVNPAPPELVVQNYFNLVGAIASRIKRRVPSHVDVQDLVQTGMIGLLEASERFNPSRAVEFSTYANSRITGAILDEMRRWDTCSRQDRKNARAIEQAKAQLRQKNGEDPGKEQIAQAVGLGLEEYDRTLRHLESSKQPSNRLTNERSEMTDDIDRLPSPCESPFDSCSKLEEFRLLHSYVNQLQPRLRKILKLYYVEDLGLKEIGERLGVGEARISQLHKQAVLELRRLIGSDRRASATRASTMVH